jgi:flagellar biogenesis protein FliO
MSKNLLSLLALAAVLSFASVNAQVQTVNQEIPATNAAASAVLNGLTADDLEGSPGFAMTPRADSTPIDHHVQSTVDDPLYISLDEIDETATSRMSGFGLEQWTRQPGLAAAISIGLVLLGYSVLRMFGGRSTPRRPGRLPRQVVELVGFVPLNNRQQLQLVRLGSKLVLVAVSANGTEPLAEVTDPLEVEQILAACQSGQSALAGAIGRWSGRARQSARAYSPTGNRGGTPALFEA